MMKRLFLVFSLVAILTAVCGVHATVPDPAGAYTLENSKRLVPRSLSGRIICRNDPINAFDPDGRKLQFANGVSDKFKAQFKVAIQHLNTHGAAGTIAKLQERKEMITIQPGCKNDNFDPNSNIITWDPTGAFVSDNGEAISPATALVHEAGHALLEVENPGLAATLSDKEYREGHPLHAYEDAEEYLNITTVEWPVAEKLGEDKRTTHSGTYVTVESPTNWVKKNDSVVKSEE